MVMEALMDTTGATMVQEDPNGNNGNHAEGNNNHVPAQVGTRTTGRIIPRPLMPQFLGNQQTGNQG
jgi:hypothetical protein